MRVAVIVDFPRPAGPVLSDPAELLVGAVRAVAAQDVRARATRARPVPEDDDVEVASQ